MMEALAKLDAQQLMVVVISAASAFMALDVWQRANRAARVLGAGAYAVASLVGWGLLAWFGGALALTFVPALRDAVNAVPPLRPALMVIGIAIVTAMGLSPGGRRAFDSLPWEDVLTLSYWRAIFGAALLALYTGGFFPAAFGLAAGLGDIAVTLLMVLLLVLAERLGRMPRRPLLVWHTLGLLDLLNVPLLFVSV